MSTESIRRLAARTLSDARRGVPFEIGLKHFAELIVAACEELDRKLDELDKRTNKG